MDIWYIMISHSMFVAVARIQETCTGNSCFGKGSFGVSFLESWRRRAFSTRIFNWSPIVDKSCPFPSLDTSPGSGVGDSIGSISDTFRSGSGAPPFFEFEDPNAFAQQFSEVSCPWGSQLGACTDPRSRRTAQIGSLWQLTGLKYQILRRQDGDQCRWYPYLSDGDLPLHWNPEV